MTEERLPSKFAFILHADVAGSTELVRQDEHVAHTRIQDTFRRFDEIITKYHGHVRELRGDALLAEFERASDAVSAALAFQAHQSQYNIELNDTIQPTVRVGIAMGEVVIADNTITGDGVVLAQRLEQLANSGGVCIQDAAYQSVPKRLPFEYEDLGEQELKGFEDPVRVYAIALKSGASIPLPETRSAARVTKTGWRVMIGAAAAALITVGGGLAWWQPWVPREEPASVERMAFPLPDKPSIAVLPFDNLGGDPEQEILADGLTNDVITDLSKFGHLFVIASNSTFSYKGKAVKVQQVAEELGVRYVLEGSFQRAGERLRINTQLIDAITGHHLWAERYDRDASDFFAIQEDILRTIVASLASQITEAEIERALGKVTDDLGAYDFYQRAWKLFFTFTKEGNNQALELLQKAIELDPDYARAYGLLAWVHANNSSGRYSWGEDPEHSLDLTLKTAGKAVQLAPDDYFTHWALGFASMVYGDYNRAEVEYDRALALNPSDSNLLTNMAELLYKTGRAEQAITQIKLAMRINPRHSDWYFWDLGLAQYIAGQYREALDSLNRMSNPSNGVRRTRAAVLVRLERLEEARDVMSKFIETDIDTTLEEMEGLPWTDREGLQRWIDDLRVAGLPEKRPLPLPDKPSIAVLPFDAYSDESEQKYFANGLTEDLITALSRIPDLFVIARTSTQKYKGKEVDVREVAKELGVGYVLEGSIQKSGDTIRINAQLIDGVNGNHIWAKKYDRPATDFFAIQDDIVRRILVEMHVKLIVGDHAKVASRGTKSLDAWLLGRQAAAEGLTFTPEGMVRARQLFQEAHETDPEWSRPLAGVAWTRYEEARFGWSKSREESIDQGIDLAKQAIEMDPKDPFGYMQLGNLMILQGEWDQGLALREKAIELAPNDFFALVGLAYLLIWFDDAERALEIYQRTRKVSPIAPWWMLASESLALHMNGQHDQAIQRVKESMERNPKHSALHARLAAIYSDLGRDEEAQKQMDMYLKAKPNATIATTMKSHTFKDQARAEWYAELLRKAGLPD